MDKKDLFDALDDFSQTLLVTLAEVEAVKKNLKSVVEENIALHLENDKLRERLGEVEKEAPTKTNSVILFIRDAPFDTFVFLSKLIVSKYLSFLSISVTYVLSHYILPVCTEGF